MAIKPAVHSPTPSEGKPTHPFLVQRSLVALALVFIRARGSCPPLSPEMRPPELGLGACISFVSPLGSDRSVKCLDSCE